MTGTGSEAVEIDLNGFTVTGDPAGNFVPILISNVRTLVLRNGSVRSTPGSLGHVVSVSTATQEGKVVVEDLKVTGGQGVAIDAPSSAFWRNFIYDTAGDGLVVSSALGFVVTGVIEDNFLRNIGGRGIYVSGLNGGVSIENNRVGAVGHRIQVDNGHGLAVTRNSLAAPTPTNTNRALLVQNGSGCLITKNQCAFGSGMMLIAVSDSLVTDNLVGNMTATGITLQGSARNILLRNVSTFNAQDGILLENSTENALEGNKASTNLNIGIHFTGTSTNNRYGRNTAESNAGGVPCPANNSACTAPGVCDEVLGNVSFGDNSIPGPC
jgi:parallel beta-helix repeat protein